VPGIFRTSSKPTSKTQPAKLRHTGFRTGSKIVTSIAAASAFLLVPAAAQAATHPVQVTGAQLKSALLPTSTFGSDFSLLGTSSSGKSLWHKQATKHVPTMSCVNFENGGLANFGESAVAISASIDNSALTGTTPSSLSNLTLVYEQEVYQFPSTKAAVAFYNQAYAKYASCKSFSDTAAGAGGDNTKITLKSIARTKVGTHQAFKLTQGLGDSGLPGLSLNLNTLVTRSGADVFLFVDFSTTNHTVAPKTMLKLVDRVKALR
jgi:hypothetical protein